MRRAIAHAAACRSLRRSRCAPPMILQTRFRHAETSATVFHTSPAAAAAERRKTQEQKKNSLDVERRLNQRRTRIVATIGPSSESPEVLAELLEAGLDVARINYSHGTPEDKTDLIATLREAERAHGRPLGILADLPGPKLRMGYFEEEHDLAQGTEIELHCGEQGWTSEVKASKTCAAGRPCFPVAYDGLSAELKDGDPILINDGLVKLEVLEAPGVHGRSVVCKVVDGGIVSSRKGINVPGTLVSLPSVGPNDQAALRHALKNDVDFVAVSYVRTAADLEPAKKLIAELRPGTLIVAKIEHPAALQNLDAICDSADILMVARGDLGVEMYFEEVPHVQEGIIRAALSRAKPVIVATQVLESMTRSPVPTRAEVNDISNAIRQGTHAMMLSGETASGKYPVKAVKMMAKVAARCDTLIADLPVVPTTTLAMYKSSMAVANAAVQLSKVSNVDRLIIATSTGYTVRLASAYRPKCAITAMSNSMTDMRRTTLLWGVDSVYVPESQRASDTVQNGLSKLVADGRVMGLDAVVVVSGSPLAIHCDGNQQVIRFINVLEKPDQFGRFWNNGVEPES